MLIKRNLLLLICFWDKDCSKLVKCLTKPAQGRKENSLCWRKENRIICFQLTWDLLDFCYALGFWRIQQKYLSSFCISLWCQCCFEIVTSLGENVYFLTGTEELKINNTENNFHGIKRVNFSKARWKYYHGQLLCARSPSMWLIQCPQVEDFLLQSRAIILGTSAGWLLACWTLSLTRTSIKGLLQPHMHSMLKIGSAATRKLSLSMWIT